MADIEHPIQTHILTSADGCSLLVSYLWRPKQSGRRPAVVLLHGRRGPYDRDVNGTYTARPRSPDVTAPGERCGRRRAITSS